MDNYYSLEQKYLTPEEHAITCDSCGRVLKSGDKYLLDITGTVKCFECIEEELMEVD